MNKKDKKVDNTLKILRKAIHAYFSSFEFLRE